MMREMTEAEFGLFRGEFHKATGILCPPEKRCTVGNRINRRLRATDARDLGSYLTRLAADHLGLQQLVTAITARPSYFFRDRRQWDAFERWCGSTGTPLRIWCVAAGSAIDAFSTAIATIEQFGPVRAARDVEILATDGDRALVASGQRPEFDRFAVAQMDRTVVRRHFQRTERGTFLLAPQAARLVAFRAHDPRCPIDGDPFDAVLLRSALPHFDQPTQRQVLEQVYRAMPPGGLLMLGERDKLLGLEHRFEAVAPAVFRVRQQSGAPRE